MNEKKTELIATLNAIAEVSEKLAAKDESYKKVSRVAKRIASLEKEGFSEDTIIILLYIEGFISREQLSYLLNMKS